MPLGVKVRLIDRGVRELLNAPGVRSDIYRRARAVARAAGDGYMATPAREGRARCRSAVVAVTAEARLQEASQPTLVRAIEAAR